MSAAMTHGERCLLAVSPEREVSRMSDGELRELVDEIAARPWTNEFWDRLAGIAVEAVVNRWMAGGARS